MNELITLIEKIAKSQNVDPNLALAIAYVESGFDSAAVRYEPRWEYLVTPQKFARQLRITLDTETVLQMLSYNCLQIMGSNCRAMGYSGHLTYMVNPDLGILYGMKFIRNLKKIYTNELDLISSYNQGSPVKLNGEYRNNSYVVKVAERLNYLRNKKG